MTVKSTFVKNPTSLWGLLIFSVDNTVLSEKMWKVFAIEKLDIDRLAIYKISLHPTKSFWTKF